MQRFPGGTTTTNLHRTPIAAASSIQARRPVAVYATPIQPIATKPNADPVCSFPQVVVTKGDVYGSTNQGSKHSKPKCPYTCLIGMAMMANNYRPLAVGDIYMYIE